MHSGSPPTQRVDNQPQNNLNLVIRDGKIQSGHLSCYNLTKHFCLVVENMLDVSFTSSISDLYHQSSDVCVFLAMFSIAAVLLPAKQGTKCIFNECRVQPTHFPS